MPERPDLRLIAGNIREALEGYSREELLEVLTYVFKEYVVEGPPPLLVNQSERVEDLEGLGFGQLISALQTRLDLPELSLFSVDGGQVSVRVGGVMTPLTGGAAAPEPEPPPPAPAEPAPAERPRAGVRIEETGTVQRPERVSAPPPRGLSIRGRPGATGATAARPAAANQPSQSPPAEQRSENQPANPPASQPASPQPENKAEPPSDSDDASVRFSLLELD